MKKLLIIFSFLVSGCATTIVEPEQVLIPSPNNQVLVDDIQRLLSGIYAKSTTFNFETTGSVSTSLQNELRKEGFALSQSNGVVTKLFIDYFDSENIYLRLLLDNKEYTRKYSAIGQEYNAVNSWTQFNNEGE